MLPRISQALEPSHRPVVEQVPSLVLDLPHTEAFYEMPAWLRLLLPTLGGLFIGLVFQMLRPAWLKESP